MAKDKAAKERERAKRVKQKKLRDEGRRAQVQRHLHTIEDALLKRTPEAMAVLLSSVPGSTRQTPVPSHYAELAQFLEQPTDEGFSYRTFIECLCDAILGGEFCEWNGLMTWCAPGAEDDLDVVSMPSALLRYSLDPWKWMHFADDPGVWCFWVTVHQDCEGGPVPLVFARDSQGRLAAWFVHERIWHSISMPDLVIELADGLEGAERDVWADENPALFAALVAAGVFPEHGPLSRLNPESRKFNVAVFAFQKAQAPLVDSLVDLAIGQEHTFRTMDEVWERSLSISKLEREAGALNRRLASTQEDLERHKTLLAQARAKESPRTHVPRLSLVDRLGKVFE